MRLPSRQGQLHRQSLLCLDTVILLCQRAVFACFDCCRIETNAPRYNASSSTTLSWTRGKGPICTRLCPTYGAQEKSLTLCPHARVTCPSQQTFMRHSNAFEIALWTESYGSTPSASTKPT